MYANCFDFSCSEISHIFEWNIYDVMSFVLIECPCAVLLIECPCPCEMIDGPCNDKIWLDIKIVVLIMLEFCSWYFRFM